MAKEYEVAFRLGAELESSFSKSFTEASSDFKKLHKDVQAMQKGSGESNLTKPVRDDLKKTQDEMRNTESSANNMTGMLKKAGAAVVGFFAVRNIIGIGKDIANVFAEFEQGMANVKALSGATNEDLAKMTKVAKDLGASTIFSAKEAADGMQYLALAGYNTNEIIAAMPGLLDLAAAANMDLAQASDIVSDTMMAFAMQADQATMAADIFARAQSRSNTNVYQLGEAMKYAASTASAANMDLVQTASILGVLADSGIKGSMAGTTFNAMLRDLKKNSEDGKAAIGETTIALYDQQGAMRDLGTLMREIEEATEGMTTQQRDAALANVFKQESLRGVNIMLQTGSKRYAELEDMIRNSSGAAEEMAKTQMDTLKGSLEELSGAIETAKIEIGERLAPHIRKAADYIAGKLPEAIDKLMKNWPHYIENAKSFGKAIIGIGAAVGTLKAVKGVKDTFNVASSSISIATKSARLFGPTIAALSNPVGIGVVAIGALTLGIKAFKAHQEKARQEVIRMGDSLKDASMRYQRVADSTKQTRELVKEYEELSRVIESNTDNTKDLSAEKERLADVITMLQGLHPGIITQYDIENGLIKEKIRLLEREAEIDQESAKRELAREMRKASDNLPALEKELAKLQEITEERRQQIDDYNRTRVEFKAFELEYDEIFKLSDPNKIEAELEKLLEKVNKSGERVGLYYYNAQQFLGSADYLKDTWGKLSDQQDKDLADLENARKSYAQLYQSRKDLIELELNNGNKIEDQVQRFKELSAEEKKRFRETLASVASLDREMNKLKDRRINIEVIYSQIGEIYKSNVPIVQDRGLSLTPYADGDIVSRPTPGIFGEAGTEALIPINNKPRSHALLDAANRMMGRSSGNEYSINYAPQIIIQGGGSDVQREVAQALHQAQLEFEKRFKAMIKQERRLAL